MSMNELYSVESKLHNKAKYCNNPKGCASAQFFDLISGEIDRSDNYHNFISLRGVPLKIFVMAIQPL
jgi:hypothetical protein